MLKFHTLALEGARRIAVLEATRSWDMLTALLEASEDELGRTCVDFGFQKNASRGLCNTVGDPHLVAWLSGKFNKCLGLAARARTSCINFGGSA